MEEELGAMEGHRAKNIGAFGHRIEYMAWRGPLLKDRKERE